MAREDLQVRTTILLSIREGRPTLADFVDCTGKDAADVVACTAAMEEEGLIERLSDVGIGSLTYRLTAAGEVKLPPLDKQAKELLQRYGIGTADLKILQAVAAKGEMLQDELYEKLKLPNDETISRLTYLVEKGYLEDRGLFRRIVRLSGKGKTLVTEAS